mmetsp:Transcript_9512/g.58027  ORF Transcript_9512/g.58027 Transcript_9512/m.58027 type:complete len:224 (+) Transcript_9512:442-1113(+)
MPSHVKRRPVPKHASVDRVFERATKLTGCSCTCTCRRNIVHHVANTVSCLPNENKLPTTTTLVLLREETMQERGNEAAIESNHERRSVLRDIVSFPRISMPTSQLRGDSRIRKRTLDALRWLPSTIPQFPTQTIVGLYLHQPKEKITHNELACPSPEKALPRKSWLQETQKSPTYSTYQKFPIKVPRLRALQRCRRSAKEICRARQMVWLVLDNSIGKLCRYA